MPASEYTKLESGDPLFLRDFPHACFCGSQKGPIVATAHAYRAGEGANAVGHVYVCRTCGTRIARAFGIVKGVEMDRLQNAADELAAAAAEVETRQRQVDELTRTNGEREAKIGALRAEIERRDAEITHLRSFVNETLARGKDVVAV